jgi:hypothetical protein
VCFLHIYIFQNSTYALRLFACTLCAPIYFHILLIVIIIIVIIVIIIISSSSSSSSIIITVIILYCYSFFYLLLVILHKLNNFIALFQDFITNLISNSLLIFVLIYPKVFRFPVFISTLYTLLFYFPLYRSYMYHLF